MNPFDTSTTPTPEQREEYRKHLRTATYHPAVVQVLSYFRWDHLPPTLQDVSRPFGELAQRVAERAPANPETTVALRKLLESKDAAVRAALPPAQPTPP